jgi:hypothetical protein
MVVMASLLLLLALLFEASDVALILLLHSTAGALKEGWTTLRLIASAGSSPGARAVANDME